MVGDIDALLALGTDALRDCRWADAATLFETVLERTEHPDALDGLGRARYWLQDYEQAFTLRERAFALHRGSGANRAAALIAVRLAQWYALVHGNGAAMNGWMSHAARLLEDDADCAEAGWLELFRGCVSADPAERRRRTRSAAGIGSRAGDAGLEFDARGYEGKALVEQGDVERGMALLDEAVAAVTSGLVTDPWAAGEIWCVLFGACELVADVTRAESWLSAVDGYVQRTGELPIQAICRMHYGGALTAVGRLDDAEEELRAALAIYDRTYTGTRAEPLLRLAELHARAGRTEEAARMLAGHEHRDAAARAHALVLAAAGEHVPAVAVLERALSPGRDLVTDVQTLALGSDVAIEGGDVEAAERFSTALGAMATGLDHPSVTSLALRCRAIVAAARARPDARGLLTDAVAALAAAGLERDAALTRLTLAEHLADGEPALARVEARTAQARLRGLGADRAADRAAALLRQLGDRAPVATTGGAPGELAAALTPRQLEVLRLVAEGLSNAAIAERLVVSTRTVEHHVSRILRALGARSRTEAAAALLRDEGGPGRWDRAGRGAAGPLSARRAPGAGPGGARR